MTTHLSMTPHGAARSVTGSRHIIRFGDKRLLLDCGLFQGRRKETYSRNLEFSFDPLSVDAMLLSHAHIDHSGNLPNLVKLGYEGDIYCTPATLSLARVMLRDSAYIQEKDAAWVTRRNLKRGKKEPPVQPIYTTEHAIAALDLFKSIDYDKSFTVLPDIEAKFQDAGHILGSASIQLDINDNGAKRRVIFSGDIGRVGLPLLRDPVIPKNADWLIMEGTYGAREHDPVSEACEELREVVERAVARGGKILIPSFSVERTQEILFYLNNLTNEGKLPPIPVFLDSPLAVNVTEIFRQHKECYDDETLKIMETDPDPIGFDRLKMIRSVDESKALNYFHGSCIIISASGMCEAGRIVHHLRNNIENPKTIIVFVGYQAEGTLGRKIVEREPRVNIFGAPRDLKAEVATLNTMSGHADKDELFHYAKTVRDNSPNLKGIVLIHGEANGLETFGQRLRSELQLDVTIPELEEEVVFQS